MKNVVLILHFYQPPSQDLTITKKILETCYLPLLRMISEKRNCRLTFNITGSLLEQLQELQAVEFFSLVKEMVDEGKVELVNSSMYHTLAPITPSEVWQRQLQNNTTITQEILGNSGEGFFPPELAVDEKSLEQIDAKYVIVDESTIEQTGVPIVRFRQKFLLVGTRNMVEVLRSSPWELHPKKVISYALEQMGNSELMVLPSDAELFGHHYVERLTLLSELLDMSGVQWILAKDAVATYGPAAPEVKRITLSSWQNTRGLELWCANELQQRYLAMAEFASLLAMGRINVQQLKLLDKGWASCHLYWLSNWPWWFPNIVQKGANFLIESVRASTATSAEETHAEELNKKLLDAIAQYELEGKETIGYRNYDATREQLLNHLPKL